MKTVFIAHPVSGDVESNIKKIIQICKNIHSEKILPIFPSFTWRNYLTENDSDKKLAETVNEEYFRRGMIDEVWLYGDEITKGMKKETKLARKYNVPVIAQSEATKQQLIEM